MVKNINYYCFLCVDFNVILKDKGIFYFSKRKEELIDLCESVEVENV